MVTRFILRREDLLLPRTGRQALKYRSAMFIEAVYLCENRHLPMPDTVTARRQSINAFYKGMKESGHVERNQKFVADFP